MSGSVAELLAEVRRSPGDAALREVLLDAWIEADDPRAALVLAERAGQGIDAALARCAARWPAEATLRFSRGLLVDVGAPLADLVEGRVQPLGEPLVVAAVAYEDAERLTRGLATASRALSRFAGISLANTVDEALLPAVHALVLGAAPERLSLTVSAPAEALAGRPWPSVRTLRLCADWAGVLAVLEGAPALRRLQVVQEGWAQAWLPTALALPDLVELDIVGLKLTDEDVSTLAAWGGHVRHERFALGPGDPVDDPFGRRPLRWPALPARTARGVVLADRQTITARGRSLQVHRDGDPHRRDEPADSPITAIVSAGADLVFGCADGSVRRADGGEIVRVGGVVRTVNGRADAVAVVHDGGWWLRRSDTITTGDEALAALLLTEDGDVRAVGDRIRWSTGREVSLGEPVLAAALAGDDVIAVTPRAVWRVHGAEDRVERLWERAEDAPPLVAAAGEAFAAATSPRTVQISRWSATADCTWPASYSDDHGGSIVLADLAVDEDGTVLVVLEAGGSNLLLSQGALKADEFPGEPVRRWLFVYGGSILVAG